MSCTVEDCCPQGWGCAAITPFLALCVESVSDDEGFECSGEKPSLESLTSNRGEEDSSEPAILVESDSNEGCLAGTQNPSRNLLVLFCLSFGLIVRIRYRLR